MLPIQIKGYLNHNLLAVCSNIKSTKLITHSMSFNECMYQWVGWEKKKGTKDERKIFEFVKGINQTPNKAKN